MLRSSRGYCAGYFAGAEEEERVQRCIDSAKVQRFRGAEYVLGFSSKEVVIVQVQSRCRAGAEQVQCRCRAGAVQVQCRCRAGAVQLQRCRSSAEVVQK